MKSENVDPDLTLIRAIADGDPAAMEELYTRQGPAILKYLVGRLGDENLAEDVLQDVMLAVWRKAQGFRGESSVRTWMLTIARNRAINAYLRRAPAAARLEAECLDPSQKADSALDHTTLYQALRSLPEEQRETLELVFFHGLSNQEAATVLKIAPGTVKSRLHRAKARLRTLIVSEELQDE